MLENHCALCNELHTFSEFTLTILSKDIKLYEELNKTGPIYMARRNTYASLVLGLEPNFGDTRPCTIVFHHRSPGINQFIRDIFHGWSVLVHRSVSGKKRVEDLVSGFTIVGLTWAPPCAKTGGPTLLTLTSQGGETYIPVLQPRKSD